MHYPTYSFICHHHRHDVASGPDCFWPSKFSSLLLFLLTYRRPLSASISLANDSSLQLLISSIQIAFDNNQPLSLSHRTRSSLSSPCCGPVFPPLQHAYFNCEPSTFSRTSFLEKAQVTEIPSSAIAKKSRNEILQQLTLSHRPNDQQTRHESFRVLSTRSD